MDQFLRFYKNKTMLLCERIFQTGDDSQVHKGSSKLGGIYLNFIELCDQQQDVYASLPYRVYFKYKLRGFSSIPDEEGLLYVPDIDGEIYRDVYRRCKSRVSC